MNALVWRSPADLRGACTECISVGDVVRTGDNFHPQYQVIALAEDRAWIRDTQHGIDHVVPLERCQRV